MQTPAGRSSGLSPSCLPLWAMRCMRSLDHSLLLLSAPVRWVRRRRLTAGGLPHPDFRFMSATNDWQPGRALTMVGWVNGRGRGRGGNRGSEQGARQHHKDPCLSDPPHPQTAYQVTRPPKPASSQLDWLHPTSTPPPGAADGCYAHSGVSSQLPHLRTRQTDCACVIVLRCTRRRCEGALMEDSVRHLCKGGPAWTGGGGCGIPPPPLQAHFTLLV